MSDTPAKLAPPEKIIPALVHHYSLEQPEGAVSDTGQLVQLLRKLPGMSTTDDLDPVEAQLKKHAPGSVFSREDIALVKFVDESTTDLLRQTDLDFKIESYIRDITPHIAALGLETNIHKVTEEDELFDLMDLIIDECIGWSEDLGVLGDQFIEKVDNVTSGFSSGRTNTHETIEGLRELFAKEEPLFAKLEKRLVDRELKSLAGKKGEYFAADLINKAMATRQVPLFIIFMIQGPWYEFVQDIFTHYGTRSKEWEHVGKLTDAMVRSLQPGQDSGKQIQLIDQVQKGIAAFSQSVKFETEELLESLADLDGEYDAIRAGEGSEPCDFEPIDLDEGIAASLQEASQEAVKQIEAIPLGQWFIYDDPKEADEKVARIRVILNWADTEQLLLTNHNRRKVVHMSYGEMINYLNAGVLRKLTPEHTACETFRVHLIESLRAVSNQNKKVKQVEVTEDKKAISKEYVEQRQAELEQAQAELEAEAERKRQRALVLREKAKKKEELALQTVKALKQNAWVSLPIMEGTLTPCKLVAIIGGSDKYIFANRAGIKVGEYTSFQLANMIITENSEILDTGAEFESALATVVSGLREDKDKSYDELTGDTE